MPLVTLGFINLVAATSLTSAAPPDSAALAATFANQLAARSPDHDGVPLRTYVLRDLDHDGQFEVLEYVSTFEDSPGFINVELNGAFEWVNIYGLEKGVYRERTGSFRSFLMERKEHYRFWLRILEAPAALNPDSRSLVEANKGKFRSILRGYLRRIEELQ